MMFDQVAGVLAYLHSRTPPIMHQDIKPENILIDADNTYRLTDFSISSQLRSTLRKSTTSQQAMTMAYAPPERFGKRPRNVCAGDVFSLGVMAYEATTGELPWMGAGGAVLQSNQQIPLLPEGYSNELVKLIESTMAIEPDNRPSAEDLAKAADQYLEKGKWETQKSQNDKEKPQYQSEDAKEHVHKNPELKERHTEQKPADPKLKSLMPEMVKIEGGTFQMGSNASEAYDDEQPVHEVTLSDFYMGKYEVTHKQYIAFMNDLGGEKDGSYNGKEYVDMDANDCAVGYQNGEFYFKGSKHAVNEQCPMIFVSWYGANAFCEWLSKKTGQTYRLPTEAEWEYAAGGGAENRTKYAGTNNTNELDDYAWYDSNSNDETHPVGKKKANTLGLYDMSGNVWEWCNDWYKSDYYKSSPRDNPQGPSSGSGRVGRGGSWYNYAAGCRVAYREDYGPGSGTIVGFRVVFVP